MYGFQQKPGALHQGVAVQLYPCHQWNAGPNG